MFKYSNSISYATIFDMREYVNLTGVAQILHINVNAANSIFHRGSFLDADVLVGVPASEEVVGRLLHGEKLRSSDDLQRIRRGWKKERVLAYGVDIGRLDKDGNVILAHHAYRPPGRKHTRPRAAWSMEPELFLNMPGVAPLWGSSQPAVRAAHIAGRFIEPDVQIGQRLLGWRPERVVEFSRQFGKTDGVLCQTIHV